MTIVLRQAGWDAKRLDGGYKAFRRFVIADTARLAGLMSFTVICGFTGSGKSALLRELESQGAQVLDLERIARHRGSVLGGLPSDEQPGQKSFETQVWETLSGFDPARRIYVEAESRKIGNLSVPESLLEAIRRSACISLQATALARVNLLLREYDHFISDAAALSSRLDALTWLHGRERVARWKSMASESRWNSLVRELLETHYDPAYRKSSGSNYAQLSQAAHLPIAEGSPEEFIALAGKLIAEEIPGVAENAAIVV
jgi:tRNA 2-selenouridine synthase